MIVTTTTVVAVAVLLLHLAVLLVHSKGIPSLTKKNIRLHYTATVGSSVRLRCPVSGTSDPLHNRTLVTWSHGAQFIDNTLLNYSRFRLRSGKHLKIVDVGYRDAGVYTCRAYNQFGSININITLTIRKRKRGHKEVRGEPPRFKLESRSRMTYRKGETARLRCHSTGDPDPDVQWFKDNKPYGKNSKRAGVSASGWTLNLRYLTLQDGGRYMCRVTNQLGSINRTFVVRVKVRIPKPRIEDDTTRLSVRRGRNVMLDCRAKSAGRPTFTWKRWGNDYNKLNGSVNVQEVKGFGTKYLIHEIKTNNLDYNYFGTTLVITNATKTDQGKYSCFVKNNYGSDELAKYLFVVEKYTAVRLQPTEAPSTAKLQNTPSSGISVVLVAVIVSIALTIVFLTVLIFCCRKQRKDLEKKYVINYAPDPLYQAEQDVASQELPKMEHPPEKNIMAPSEGKHVTSSALPSNYNHVTSTTLPSNNHVTSTTLPSNYNHVTSTMLPSNNHVASTTLLSNNHVTSPLPGDGSRIDNVERESDATERRISNSESLDGLDTALSRTSSDRTLSTNSTNSRERFIHAKGGTDYTTKCHDTCGEICRCEGETNTTGKSGRDLRESIV